MDDNSKIFPVIDIRYLSENYTPWKASLKETFCNDPLIAKLAEQIASSFVKWGFLYLINHGIKDEIIADSYKTANNFFKLDQEVKNSFPRTKEFKDGGYLGYDSEKFEFERPFDIKEAFDYTPLSSYNQLIDGYVPLFNEVNLQFFDVCQELSYHLIRLITIALNLKDEDYLINHHRKANDITQNPTLLRFLLYPPINSKEQILHNQLRCGEHSDYGTLTLLFQDDAGGLQVVNPEGEYIDATPIKGSIIVNSADMLEIWSAGKFKSTRHRVVIPSNLDQPRQSLAFFLHPDYDSTVQCIDGSNKYETLNVRERHIKKSNETYGYK